MAKSMGKGRKGQGRGYEHLTSYTSFLLAWEVGMGLNKGDGWDIFLLGEFLE